MKSSSIISLICDQGFLPLFYDQDKAVSISVVDILYQCGIRTIEYTNRGEHALSNFKAISRERLIRWPGMVLGIGTIKSKSDAISFLDAGADYIISPAMITEVGEMALNSGTLWIPGCMTPTEISLADNAGAKMVKIFPGNILGPGFITAVKDIFPDMLFMPTGGVELQEKNLREWFAAGVCAVGIGSKMISKELLADRNFNEIGSLANNAIELLKIVRYH
ncbi:bifunctional 4-hydroxy-2-oxoglutarate aldolase/2-dehydro-3-deoxy-phosphogluconate aldolase [Flavihumibacter sp. ZG627]|uniref:bifunctional 4-hydroxy-2-oxoglutarate aldolase/2-dehydro-3-deoxy-phosphogluconate aldolase n=1 Tax=Flavihumibacter sp. ZG627 TaxID=1463156 RepID=UPI00057FDA8D|nr:ketohydroxyglutarate aldolase [Flavihumibacter sp. ZG627]KIC90399.1 ketohydroxyglutarate aldolase [Flavihumibacter sp. ZG627]